MISNPSRLDCRNGSIRISQDDEVAHVPIEDVSVIVLATTQVQISGALLSALADAQIALFTIGSDHHPNGVLLPFLSHSRSLQVMRRQLAMKLPPQKRLWQRIVRQKIRNQACVLAEMGRRDPVLEGLAEEVRSGDSFNTEAHAAHRYFRGLWGQDFTRSQDRFANLAMNYGYAVVRASIARTLVAYGFLPAFGIFHRSEQNAFNLADDLLEPFRPLIDAHIRRQWRNEPDRELLPADKPYLVTILNQDFLTTASERMTCLATINLCVQSLTRWLEETDPANVVLPMLETKIPLTDPDV